jgi:hypothetical protein
MLATMHERAARISWYWSSRLSWCLYGAEYASIVTDVRHLTRDAEWGEA